MDCALCIVRRDIPQATRMDELVRHYEDDSSEQEDLPEQDEPDENGRRNGIERECECECLASIAADSHPQQTPPPPPANQKQQQQFKQQQRQFKQQPVKVDSKQLHQRPVRKRQRTTTTTNIASQRTSVVVPGRWAVHCSIPVPRFVDRTSTRPQRSPPLWVEDCIAVADGALRCVGYAGRLCSTGVAPPRTGPQQQQQQQPASPFSPEWHHHVSLTRSGVALQECNLTAFVQGLTHRLRAAHCVPFRLVASSSLDSGQQRRSHHPMTSLASLRRVLGATTATAVAASSAAAGNFSTSSRACTGVAPPTARCPKRAKETAVPAALAPSLGSGTLRPPTTVHPTPTVSSSSSSICGWDILHSTSDDDGNNDGQSGGGGGGGGSSFLVYRLDGGVEQLSHTTAAIEHSQQQLARLVACVDAALAVYQQPPYHRPPIFHISIAQWTPAIPPPLVALWKDYLQHLQQLQQFDEEKRRTLETVKLNGNAMGDSGCPKRSNESASSSSSSFSDNAEDDDDDDFESDLVTAIYCSFGTTQRIRIPLEPL